MSKKTLFQLMIIVVALPAIPFMVLGWLIGFLWDATKVGFFWGNQFMDSMIEKEENIPSEKKKPTTVKE